MSVVTPLSPFRKHRLILPRYSDGLLGPSVTPISVSGLTAAPGLGQVVLAWSYVDISGVVDVVEVWASRTNDLTTAAHFGDAGAAPNVSLTTFTHIVGPLGSSLFYWIRARDVSGNVGPWSSGVNAGVQSTANNLPASIGVSLGLSGGMITAAVAANALTLAVKTLAGNDPSPDLPVFTTVQRTADSGYEQVNVTGPLSFTIPNGATLGTLNGVPFGLTAFIGSNAGVAALLVANVFNLPLFGVGDFAGGAGNNFDELYGTASVAAKAYAPVAFLNWPGGLATAGAWSAGPAAPIQPYRGVTPADAYASWLPYTPTISSITGTITTSSAQGRYKIVGKTCFVQILAQITANGTGATGVRLTLPPAAFRGSGNAPIVIPGQTVTSHKGVLGMSSGSTGNLDCYLYDGTYAMPGTDTQFWMEGAFEVM